MQDDFLENLNDEQRAAVEHDGGPLLIVAGAGTGKTRVITSRILKLIADKKASSSEILALTFTEKATEEMIERVDLAMPLGYEEVWIKTFHGFCKKVLRESGHEIGLGLDYKVLGKLDQWMFMKKHLFDFELDYFRPLGNPSSFIGKLVDHFGRIKEEFISADEYVSHAEGKLLELLEKTKLSAQEKIDKNSVLGIEIEEARKVLEVSKAYKKYQELMLAENFMDFGDLSYYVLKLFEERPSVLNHYRERFKYIMVDEFQDTNYSQFKLLLMLAGANDSGNADKNSSCNLCVVGDDDQSIFRWRGASLSNILQFQKEFPNAKKIVLTQNYRSTQNILDASHSFIKFNDPNRLEYREKISKDLKSQIEGSGLPIEAMRFGSHADEIAFVVNKIKELTNEKGENEQQFTYKEIAVLVRANSHALPFAEEMKKAGIPFRIKNPKGLLSYDEIKDIVSLVRGLSNFDDNVAWMRLIRMSAFDVPMADVVEILGAVKIKNTNIATVLREMKPENSLPGLESPLVKFIKFMDGLLEYSKNKSSSDVIGRFLSESGILKYLSSRFDEETQNILENITAFSKIVWQFEKVSDDKSIIGLSDFLRLIEESNIPLSDEGEGGYSDENAVQILTTHSAKGLEFHTVFVCNLVSGRFPFLNKKDSLHIPLELTKEIFPDGDYHLEEERRLFYVAITRAKKNLFLTYSDRYDGPKTWKRSQFLDEISESGLVKASEGPVYPIVTKTEKKTLVIDTSPKNLLKRKTLSYSQIDTFTICPLKYGYRYVLGVPTPMSHAANFGTCIHDTLKDFYRVLIDDPSACNFELMKSFYEKNWISVGFDGPDHERARKVQGLEVLENFYNENSNPWIVPTFIEKNFNLKIGENMLNGRIDRIDKMPDGSYEVIDYKTGKSKDRLEKKHKLQLYFYALACRDVLSIPVSKLSLYYIEDCKKLSLTLSKGYDEINSVKEDILSYIEEMKNSELNPTPNHYCEFCDYKLICPAV